MSDDNDAGDQQQHNDSVSKSSSSMPMTTIEEQENLPHKLIEYVKANKVDVAMWATQLLTVLFTLDYILPIFGTPQSSYKRVLLSNAATSALRLHQRWPGCSLSRQFFSRLFAEDSCHYLRFSLIFFKAEPKLLILIPIALYGLLHASRYSLKLLDLFGKNSCWVGRYLISKVELQSINILKFAAYAEIFIMPLAVILALTGKAGFMTPLIYIPFLRMRYSSPHDPYTRYAFTELRMFAESLATRSPPIVGKILRTLISFVNRLAPKQATAQ